MIRYSLARLGMFVAVAAVLFVLPVTLNSFVKLMIALIASMLLSFFVFTKWRREMGEFVASGLTRRQERKQQLDAALAGDDEPQVPPVPEDRV